MAVQISTNVNALLNALLQECLVVVDRSSISSCTSSSSNKIKMDRLNEVNADASAVPALLDVAGEPAASDDDSLADLLVAPGADVTKKMKEDNEMNTSAAEAKKTREVVLTAQELAHYKEHYAWYYAQYMEKQAKKDKVAVDPEQQREEALCIPSHLRKFKWLHSAIS